MNKGFDTFNPVVPSPLVKIMAVATQDNEEASWWILNVSAAFVAKWINFKHAPNFLHYNQFRLKSKVSSVTVILQGKGFSRSISTAIDIVCN